MRFLGLAFVSRQVLFIHVIYEGRGSTKWAHCVGLSLWHVLHYDLANGGRGKRSSSIKHYISCSHPPLGARRLNGEGYSG